MLKKPLLYKILLLFAFALMAPFGVKAYSVFAHEAIIDASWKKSIVPLLRTKYPNITDEQLKMAHSYAYGGSLIADMGYFPFGNVYFTDLIHYVRSGDFVEALLSEAKDCNEYAFALGALSHYLTDKYGHSLATNVAVPIVYPQIGKKFGKLVTYEQDHLSHSRMEFAFDVLQVARGNYASQEYHDLIGFNVARPVLERAFLKTYGEDINEVFGNLSLTISTFRWSVKSLLPGLTKTAWALKGEDIIKANPGASSRKFHYRMKRRDYIKEFGSEHQKPGLKGWLISAILRVTPKIGPLKALKFKPPGPEGEKLFIASFDTVLVYYASDLNKLHSQRLNLPDIDFDTGKRTAPGEYTLADQAYNELILSLQKSKFSTLTHPLKQNIVSFYKNADTTKLQVTDKNNWIKARAALRELRQAAPVPLDSLKLSKSD